MVPEQYGVLKENAQMPENRHDVHAICVGISQWVMLLVVHLHRSCEFDT